MYILSLCVLLATSFKSSRPLHVESIIVVSYECWLAYIAMVNRPLAINIHNMHAYLRWSLFILTFMQKITVSSKMATSRSRRTATPAAIMDPLAMTTVQQ